MKKKKSKKIDNTKIYITGKVNYITQMCRKVDKSRVKGLNPAVFLKYILRGIQDRHVIVLVALRGKNPKNISGGVVLSVIQPDAEIAFWIDFVWVSPKNRTLGSKLMKAVIDIAKELGVNKVQGRMAKNSQAAEKKYGFKEIYKVVEKEI